jgi:hypothetical protein
MTLTRRTNTGRVLRLVVDEPTALEVEVARLERKRREKREHDRAVARLVWRRETWWERLRRRFG